MKKDWESGSDDEADEGKKPKGKFQKGEKLPKPPTHKVIKNDDKEETEEGA